MRTKNLKLAREIIEMAKLDQKARRAYLQNPSFLKEMEKVDKLNLTKMKEVLKKFGWPTISLVGKKASHMAWLLIQHADSDVELQEECLQLMKRLAKVNEVSKRDIAYLADRILTNRGKPQIYGTQFYRNKTNKLVPRPIKGIKTLDKRRKEMGLETFSHYKSKLGTK